MEYQNMYYAPNINSLGNQMQTLCPNCGGSGMIPGFSQIPAFRSGLLNPGAIPLAPGAGTPILTPGYGLINPAALMSPQSIMSSPALIPQFISQTPGAFIPMPGQALFQIPGQQLEGCPGAAPRPSKVTYGTMGNRKQKQTVHDFGFI